jgi:predicted Zn-dependent peptidase
VIAQELMRAAESIGDQEVKRAGAQMRASLLMSQESPASRAGQMARQLMFKGDILPNAELLERLAAITPQRLVDLAAATFVGSRPTLAAIGPISRLPRLDELASLMGSAPEEAPAAALS